MRSSESSTQTSLRMTVALATLWGLRRAVRLAADLGVGLLADSGEDRHVKDSLGMGAPGADAAAARVLSMGWLQFGGLINVRRRSTGK